jgi:DNA (cytosine-5)-methyltransferase 1
MQGRIIIEDDIFDHIPVSKRFIDLFCGIGGFHQAMSRIGYSCVFACDIDEKCRDVYQRNYGVKPDSDITQVDETLLPDFDVLCAGFPCQPFSNGGQKRGLEDKRGNLFEHILRIASHKRPSFLFLENVKHIKTIDDGRAFTHICERIREEGYVMHADSMLFELSPHQFGIPQCRERVVFTCIRADVYDREKKFALVPQPIPIKSILESSEDRTLSRYRISAEIEQVLTAWDEMIQAVDVGTNLSPAIIASEFGKTYTEEQWTALPVWKRDYVTRNKPLYEAYQAQWDAWYQKHADLWQKREIYSQLEWQTGKKKEGDSIWNYFIQIRQSGIRVRRTEMFPTLVAIVQTPIYAKERRYLTPRECARLQSFPDSFVLHPDDKVAYKQFGNSVNVDVIHYVVKHVLGVYGR